MLVVRRAGQGGQGLVHGGFVAGRAPAVQLGDLAGLDRRIHDQDPALGVGGQRRVRGLRVAVDAHHRLLAGLDPPDALAVGVHQGGLHVRHGLDRAALILHDVELRPRALEQLADQAVHHLRALEDVRVLEQVGLEGQHLLDAQRPLLVPRPRQAQRLVPGRELDGPSAGAAPEGDRQRLERDPLHVVLRLRLGQPERVDLHAVPETPLFLGNDAVARQRDRRLFCA